MTQEQRHAPQPIELRFFATDGLPPAGSKFVAFYGDGSGAKIFKSFDDGKFLWACDGDVEEMDAGDFMDAEFHSWALLPDDSDIWEGSK